MKTGEIRYIKKNLSALLTKTRYDSVLVAELRSRDIISEYEQSQLDARGITNSSKLEKMYDILTTKENGYIVLQQCLEVAGYSGAAKILKEGPHQIRFNLGMMNGKFFGRTTQLQKLASLFNRQPVLKNISDNITCITGMGGIGKTELCKTFIYNYIIPNKISVVWINGDSDISIKNSFMLLAESVNIDTKSSRITREYTSVENEVFQNIKDDEVVFVFDNVDETYETVLKFSQNLEGKLKTAPQVLVTSRLQEWSKKLGQNCELSLEEMTTDEATKWVAQELEVDTEECKSLVEKVDGHPLAIQQAIAYINSTVACKTQDEVKPRTTYKQMEIRKAIKAYMHGLNENRHKLNLLSDSRFQNQTNNYSQTTLTTFVKSIKYILLDAKSRSAEYLRICAYLQPDEINSTYFTGRTQAAVDKDFELLRRRSLLKSTHGKPGIYKIHRLLCEVLQCYFSTTLDHVDECMDLESKYKEALRNFYMPEENILEQAIHLLKKVEIENVRHATTVWKFASKHKALVKEFFPESLFGLRNQTPLHLLAENGESTATESLLHLLHLIFNKRKTKEYVNMVDASGRTAAFLASSRGHSQVIETLWKHNADLRMYVTICENSLEKLTVKSFQRVRMHALHISVYNDHNHAVSTLKKLDPGLCLDLKGYWLQPILLAAKLGNLETVIQISSDDFFAQMVAISTKIVKGTGCIQDLKNVIIKVEKSALPNLLNRVFNQVIVFGTTVQVLNLLLESGADVPKADRFPDFYNHTVRSNNVEVFIWLIEQNLKISNCIDTRELLTLLIEAGNYGSTDIIDFILTRKNGIVINVLDLHIDTQDHLGNTALYQAACHGWMKTIQYLVNSGANINLQNKLGTTAIIAASWRANFDVVYYLLSRPETKVQPVEIEKQANTILGLLNMTVLHAAVAYDSVTHTKKLLEILTVREKTFVGIALGDDIDNSTLPLLHTAAIFDCPNYCRM